VQPSIAQPGNQDTDHSGSPQQEQGLSQVLTQGHTRDSEDDEAGAHGDEQQDAG
jgi:hypothetical protein